MSLALSDSQILGLVKFVVIGIAVPVAYVLLNIVIRQNIYRTRTENWFCGLDLSLASLVVLGSWILEPPARFLPDLWFINPWMVSFKNEYGLETSMIIDVLDLLFMALLHRGYIQSDNKIKNPSRATKLAILIKHGILGNALGLFTCDNRVSISRLAKD